MSFLQPFPISDPSFPLHPGWVTIDELNNEHLSGLMTSGLAFVAVLLDGRSGRRSTSGADCDAYPRLALAAGHLQYPAGIVRRYVTGTG